MVTSALPLLPAGSGLTPIALCLQYGQIDIDSSLVASVDKLQDSGQVSSLDQAALHSCSALQQALEWRF